MKMENTKSSKVLKIIAIVLYVVAGIFGVIGIAVAIKTMMSGNFHFSLQLPGNIDSNESTGESEFKLSDFGSMYFVIGIFVAFVATIFLVLSKSKKKTITKVFSDSDYNMFTEVNDKPSKEQPKDPEPVEEKVEEKKKIFCAYCGSELEETDKRCPNCGSSKKVIR